MVLSIFVYFYATCFYLHIFCIQINVRCFSRAVHILPNRVLGVVGQHMEDFPVESLTQTADQSCVASCSHDQRVKFWNVEELETQTVDTSKKGTKLAKKNKVKFGKAKQNDFFSGLMGDSGASGSGETTSKGDSDDDDSDEDSD